MVAVAESGEKPFITLWCPVTYKKKKTINLPTEKETSADRFTAMAFTFDSKYLVCVSGEPDWVLYYFRCDKGKLESSARANNISNTGYVRHVLNRKFVLEKIQNVFCRLLVTLTMLIF